MKPRLENLAHVAGPTSYHSFELEVPTFPFFWHYHPEYELTYITEGRGQRLVGDSFAPFGPDDLVLVGPNLPHTWESQAQPDGTCSAQVVQFSHDWVRRVMPLPEFQAVYDMLARSHTGLLFAAPDARQQALFDRVQHQNGTGSLLALLELLAGLSMLSAKPLAGAGFTPVVGAQSQHRIQAVVNYVQSATGEVSVSEAAVQVHLSESAFCKFFKRALGLTFTDYVNEVRIARACTLLKATDLPIHQIAIQSGFDNLAYFNRIFLRKKGVQPGRFRRG